MFNCANLTPAEAALGGLGGKPGRCFASVTGPEADDTCPAIALGVTRSTINAHATARSLITSHQPTLRCSVAGRSRIGSRLRTNACTLPKQRGRESVRGFTLAELLVSMAVLVILVLLFTQLLNSAATTMTLGNKRMDADSLARQLLDRMAIDFDQMLKRSDVSYYVKATGNTQAGNDQISFFSAVPGYYSQATYNSNASLVAYRVNADSTSASYNKFERMGKGLALNAAYPAAIPLLFLDGTYSTTIASIWPAATNSMAADSDYETAGPQVFRFEYYYLLKSANGYTVVDPTSVPPNLPTTVLSSGIGTYTVSVNGTPTSVSLWSSGTNSFVVQDVAAIVVAIAVIEPKSRVLLSTANMEKLAGANGQTSPLIDFTNGWVPGQLLSTWQTALDGITDMPRPAISGIRLYERYFYLYQ